MKYHKFLLNCFGNFTVEETIDLDEIFTQEEQSKFQQLKEKSEKELTDEESNFVDECYDKIYNKKGVRTVINYEIEDYNCDPSLDYLEEKK